MLNSASVQCPKCAVINAIAAKYCIKCGTKLMFPCRRCGETNPIGADYCKSCGTKVSDAKLGISDERANQWWAYFGQFAGYAELWQENSYVRTTLYKACLDLADSIEPSRPSFGGLAFSVPIMAQDWCAKSFHWGTEQISKGAIYIAAIGLSAFDLEKRTMRRLYYEELLSAHRENDAIVLATTDANRLSMFLQVPRPAKSTKTLLYVRAIANILGSKSIADTELGSQGAEREARDYSARVATADTYVTGLLGLFSELIERKQSLEAG